MSDVFIDLLTPPDSPIIACDDDDDVQPQVDPIAIPPAVQVDPIAEPPAALTVQPEVEPVKIGKSGIVQVVGSGSIKVHVQLAFADDWCPKDQKEESVLNMERRVSEIMVNRTPVFRTYKKGQGLGYLFPKVKDSDFTVLVVAAHSAPYQTDKKSISVIDPRQYLSFSGEPSAVQFVSFIDVAKAINQAGPFDVILLGCCQGHLLVMPRLLRSLKKNGIVMYFGDETEEPDDGVAALVVQVLIEEVLGYISICADKGNPPDVKHMFEEIYVDLGSDYAEPTHNKFQKNAAGEFPFGDFRLNISCKKVMELPEYVLDYTFAGNLHAFIQGTMKDLVTEKLKEERKRFMEENQLRIDHEYELSLAAGGGGGAAAGAP